MRRQSGILMLIGGAEDKDGDCLILREFLRLAGGEEARLEIVTAATDKPEETGEVYCKVFRELGCAHVESLLISNRKAASDARIIQSVLNATGVFFSGGDQLQITSSLGGTKMLAELEKQFTQGLVIAGTSAGASAMSTTMIVEGDSDHSPKLNTVKMSPGLGFLPGVVVDQHFAQRGRIGRLLAALGQNPSVLGLGLDEDTAVIVDGNEATVWGSQTVTFLDGRQIAYTNASQAGDSQFLALTNTVAHVLPHGYAFNLKTHQPLVFSRPS